MLLNLDWLQLYCKGVLNYPEGLKVEREKYSTRQFRHIDNIYLSGSLFATAVHCPLSSILEHNIILIKVANERLYEPSMFNALKELIKILNIEVVGITRLDVACDFNKFYRNLNPETLIKNFVSCKFRKVGQSKFKIQGTQKERAEFDYLRFGSNSSDVSCYLYNKTKELKEAKDKPYIRDCWSASGLDVSRDVWRLEFSLKGNNIKLSDVKTGELFKIDLDNLQDEKFIEALFRSFLDKYFHFKRDNGDKNVSRMPDIELFPNVATKFKRYIFRESSDSSRADKIFIRKLESVNNELRSINAENRYHLDNFMLQYITARGMHGYYCEKVQGVLMGRVNNLRKKELTFEQQQDKVNATMQENKEDVLARHERWFSK